MGDLSQHFSHWEFVCKCGCGLNVPSTKLVAALEGLREIAGRPITISGPLRCKAHNATVKNASPNSRHTPPYCDGVDIKIKGMKESDMFARACMIDDFREGGIGRYYNRIHVDVRGNKARWDMRPHRRVKVAVKKSVDFILRRHDET